MWKYRINGALLLVISAAIGFFVYSTEVHESPFAFKLGLDLRSGSHLVYRAETASLDPSEVDGAMASLRETIERRINLFGVSEPIVQIEKGGLLGGGEHRLIIELPGVTDVEVAKRLIGETPLLEFKLMRKETEALSEDELADKKLDEIFAPTGLTGRYLEKSQLVFDPNTGEPVVLLNFNKEGDALFAKLTKENIGRILAIFLDGTPISTPVIRQEITNGGAQISGGFTPQEAKDLVRNLNYGALPVAIAPVSVQTVGATLGNEALMAGVWAGAIGLLLVMIFMTIWYRVPGAMASLALVIYTVANLAIFKLVGVTLTAAGIAGLILSIGMAVDGNVLIFERTKEELRSGKKLHGAVQDGFKRAWTAIWDGNVTALVSAVVLFWFGTSLVEGFALTFGLGVVLSMVSSFTITRIFLLAITPQNEGRVSKFLFGSGLM